MASYTPLPVSAVDDPLTAELVNALRENPLAIAEGAGGAPRIQDAALSGSVTGAGINWVSARVVSNAWNGVGQTVMAYIDGTQISSAISGRGIVVSGSVLSSCDVTGDRGGSVADSRLPGSWRSQGWIAAGSQASSPAVTWLRVS